MAAKLKSEIRALLTRDAAQAGDVELLEWLSMWGMIDPSQAQTNLYVGARGSEGAPDPQGPSSAEPEDHHRRPDPEVLLINAYRICRARRAINAQGTVTVNKIAAAQRNAAIPASHADASSVHANTTSCSRSASAAGSMSRRCCSTTGAMPDPNGSP